MVKRPAVPPPLSTDWSTALPVATVSVAEAARVMGIGSSTAYRAIEAGTFPIPVQRIGGLVKILRSDLERWAAGGYAATG